MAPPDNGIYIVLGEMNLVVTAMKPVSKWNSHTYQDDDQDPLIRGFSNLKDILTTVTHLSEVEPNVFLSPFLDVIRSEDTSGPITGLALTSVNKFLSYGLVDPTCETGAAAVENIADAVTHARFVGTDTGSDEVVLMKILYVLRTLLLTPVGAQMTNESVCEIMQSCFRICFEVRLGELLRKSAEHTLMDMVQLLFSGLPQFHEDNRWGPSIKKLKMRTSTIDATRGIKKKKSPRPKHKKTIQMNMDEILPSFPIPPTSAATTPETTSLNNLSSVSVIPMRTIIGTERSGPTHNLFDINNKCSQVISQSSREFSPEETKGGLHLIDKHACTNILKATDSSEHLNIISETSDDQESIQSTISSDNNIASTEPEYVNPRGVRFTIQQVKEGIGPLIPYGLPSVRELFRFLISLINPLDRHNTEVMIQMGLSLLTVALEAGADHISCFNSLLSLVKDDLCRNLFLLLQSERLTMFAASLRVCFLLFESMRSHLKLQLEMYLTKLMDMTVSESARISYEQRENALDCVVQLWRIPGLVTELYLNYDCDLYCSNLFEDLTKLLSKNAFPVSGLYSIHLFSLDALLIVVDSIETHCHSRILNGSKASLPSIDTSSEGKINVSESLNDKLENDVVVHSPPASGYIVAQKLLEKKDSTFLVDSDNNSIKENKKPPQIKPNRMKISANIPTHDQLIAIKHKKKLLHAGTEQFNSKASKGIIFLQEQGLLSVPLNAGEVVTFLRENPKLDKKMIGEYISNRKNLNVLEAFVKSFNFEDSRIDESLRMYLETFRLPGEAPVISLLLEHFAEHWHKTNGEPFSNHDAAFTLAYAVIMLNVDQHNHNVKKQNNPMNVEEFKRNLTKVNGGQDFDQEMLEEIYNSIRSEEIVMPAEQVGLVKENYLWKMLLRRGSFKEGTFIHVPNGLFDHDLFTLIWGPTVAALSFVFDKSLDETIIQKAISGFRKCAMISAHYGMSDVFDSLVISLCKFTTLLSSAESPETLPISFGNNLKAQMAAKTMFNLAHRHGDILREGWKNILDCMVLLYRAKLLPKVFVEVEDFVDPSGKVSLIREEVPSQRTESGLFSSFYSYITLNTEAPNQRGPTIEDQEAVRQAHNTIHECHPEQLITESKFLHLDSLQELVKALIFASQGPDAHMSLGTQYEEEAAIFYLEFLIKVILHNRDRISSLWQMVRDHFFNLIVHSGEYTFLVERSVVGLLRLAIGLLRREEMAAQVLSSIRLLLLMKSTVLMRVSQQVAFALHELLKTNAANIHLAQDWYTLFTLLECVGAGANPPPLTQIPGGVDNYSESYTDTGAQSDSEVTLTNHFINTLSDRGYTSDSELYEAPSKHLHLHNSLELDVKHINSGGWLLVGKEGESQRLMSKSVPIANQYSIILHDDLRHHDSRSFVKACESLAFLIRDVAHITPENFDSCVHCIRTFVEASLNGGRRSSEKKNINNNIPKNGKDKKAMHRIMARRREDNRMKRSRSIPGQISHQASDDELENEEPQGDYHQLSLQLLDLMHTLHTRAASIFSSWAEEEKQRKLEENVKNGNLPIDAGTGTMWVKCWCPLLQGIARLCCDARRQVRTSALTYLQRALLVHDLQTLSAAEWESCFNKVLFPLLTKLLDNINQHDPLGMEETRMRAATLLCKVFLQHLSPLLSLPTFTALWLTILDFMDKYMHAYKSDMLYEAIPESLKNMLLVMNTAGVFQTVDGNTRLWTITWDRIDAVLPNLRDEVFKTHEPESRKSTQEVSKAELEMSDTSPLTAASEVTSKDPEVAALTIESNTNGPAELVKETDKSSTEESKPPSSPLTVTSPTPAFILQPPLPTVISPKSGIKHTQHLPLFLNPDVIEGTAIPIISPQGRAEHQTNVEQSLSNSLNSSY